MGYRLGVDLGTTYTAAAVLRERGVPEVVPLGTRGAAIPSVLFLSPDLGDLLVGEAAERRAVTDPDRVVRQFKRRIGDPTPLLIDPGPGRTRTAEYAAHDLAAVLIQWVVARVSEREGAKPAGVAITHPATWGPHKKDLLRGALALRGLADVVFVSEPEAAARTYSMTGRLDRRATLAVYDLGGGTFDAALLRPTGDGGFEPVGRPHGLPELGGIDFDDAILSHVLAAVGPEAADVDTAGSGDPVIVTALARLRRECVDAKEALSSDTQTEIPVLLPEVRTNVRLTRAELEAMIAPRVHATIDALDATLASAGLAPADLTNVVLTGGSSRIPVVAQMLSAHLGAPVSLDRDVDPKMAVAVGAVLALAAAAPARAVTPLPVPPELAPVDITPVVPPADAPVGLLKTPVPAPVPEPAAAAAAARADLPTARGGEASGLAPIPARPARDTSSLTGPSPEDVRLPAPRSRMRPKRALTLLALTTAIMLGTGVGVSAIRDLGGEGSTATPVRSDTLDMAKPAKKKDKDAKDSDASSARSAAATTPVSYRQQQSPGGDTATDGAGTVKAAATGSGGAVAPAAAPRTTTQQASATRRAATKPATQTGGTEAFVPVTAEEFEAPAVAESESDPADVSATDSSPAEPAAPADSSAPASDSGPADAGGWSEPEAAPAPASEDFSPPAPGAGPSGFAETAPPEAP